MTSTTVCMYSSYCVRTMWIIILIGALTTFLFYKYIKLNRYWSEKGIPYLTAWPLVGNLGPTLLGNCPFPTLLDTFYKSHPNARYIGLHHFHQPTLLLRDINIIKTVTVKDFSSFTDHSLFHRGEVDYDGLFMFPASRGWHEFRNALSPIFTNLKLKTIYNLINAPGDQLVAHMKKSVNVNIDAKDLFTRYIFDTVLLSVFGVTCDSFTQPNNPFYLMGQELLDVTGFKAFKVFAFNINATITRLFRFKVINKKIEDNFGTLLKESVKIHEQHSTSMPHMLQLYLDVRNNKDSQEFGKKKTLTENEVIKSAINFIFAGSDATSTFLSFAIYELAVNSDVQVKLQEEIKTTKQKCDGVITYDELLDMKYLDMVTLETLRKWPPVAFLDRLCTKRYSLERNLTIDEGTVCWVPVSAIHKDPMYYPNPEKFDPDRFNEENKSKQNPATFIPFGIGPRMCIGSRYAHLMGKLVLVKILENFTVVPCEKTQIPLKIGNNVLQLPDAGIWLQFEKRTSYTTE